MVFERQPAKSLLRRCTGWFGTCLPGTFDGCLENCAEGGLVEDGVYIVGLGNRIFHDRVTFETRNDESTKIRRMTTTVKRVANRC